MEEYKKMPEPIIHHELENYVEIQIVKSTTFLNL